MRSHSPCLRCTSILLSILLTGWPHRSPGLCGRKQPIQQAQRWLWTRLGSKSFTQRGIQSGQLLNQLLKMPTRPSRLGTRLAPGQRSVVRGSWSLRAQRLKDIDGARLGTVTVCSCGGVSDGRHGSVKWRDVIVCSLGRATACRSGDNHRTIHPLPMAVGSCDLWSLMEGRLC